MRRRSDGHDELRRESSTRSRAWSMPARWSTRIRPRRRCESCINFGQSACMYGEITVKNGGVEQNNFDMYRVVRMNEAPKAIDIHWIKSDNTPGGLGEPGTAVVQPAIGNAIFAATRQARAHAAVHAREHQAARRISAGNAAGGSTAAGHLASTPTLAGWGVEGVFLGHCVMSAGTAESASPARRPDRTRKASPWTASICRYCRAAPGGSSRAIASMLATVVETWGSSPRPAGAMLAVRDDGLVAGSVSGGCVEDDLIDTIRKPVAGGGQARGHDLRHQQGGRAALRPALRRAAAARAGAACATRARLDRRAGAASSGHELVARIAGPGDGRGDARRRPAARTTCSASTARACTTVHGPRWRLLVIGAGQLSQYVAQMAQALDYSVIVCDPREEYADTWDVAGRRADARHARRRRGGAESRQPQRRGRASRTIRSSTTSR